jgi:4-hydroxy-tetrahydrodipicolinate reductase
MSQAFGMTLGVAGALGRMGQVVIQTLDARAQAKGDVRVGALFDRPGTEGQGLDGRVLTSSSETLDVCQAVIDFTLPKASTTLARMSAEGSCAALIIGSTGFDAEDEAALAKAATKIAIVRSGNFSLGVNMLLGLVRRAAVALGPDGYDIEISESHHKRKIDAPSGTALMLGQAAALGRGIDLATHMDLDRSGAREQGNIGFSVQRGGGIIGEHSVMFAAEDEILTLSHSARDRSLFAKGAVEAAIWAVNRGQPGLYDMQDVLGLSA